MQKLLLARTFPICNFLHLFCSSLGLLEPLESSVVLLMNQFSSQGFCHSLSGESLKLMGFHCMFLIFKQRFGDIILSPKIGFYIFADPPNLLFII